MLDNKATGELVRLLENEYESTAKFIQGVISTSFTVRGWAVTAWGVLLGIAANRESWEFALFAFLVVVGLAALDAYHAWLYGVALSYVTTVERAISAHYKAVARGGDDPDAALDFEIDARTLNLGLYRHFPRLSFREVKRVRPKWFFTVFYPSLLVIALIVAVLTATTS